MAKSTNVCVVVVWESVRESAVHHSTSYHAKCIRKEPGNQAGTFKPLHCTFSVIFRLFPLRFRSTNTHDFHNAQSSWSHSKHTRGYYHHTGSRGGSSSVSNFSKKCLSTLYHVFGVLLLLQIKCRFDY